MAHRLIFGFTGLQFHNRRDGQQVVFYPVVHLVDECDLGVECLAQFAGSRGNFGFGFPAGGRRFHQLDLVVGEIELRGEKIDRLAAVVENGTNEESVPEYRSILAMVDNVDRYGAKLADRFGNFLDRCAIGLWSL